MATSKREILTRLQDPSLEGKQLSVVNSNGDIRHFTLVENAGKGKTGVAWKARDNYDKFFALKFVVQDDYAAHSLDSEIEKVRNLNTDLIAKIDYFGTPNAEGFESIEWSEMYAIAVEWIDGKSLDDYAAVNEISIETFLKVTRDFCELLKALQNQELIHSDLKSDNVLVTEVHDILNEDKSIRLIAIDSGQLKSLERRNDLVGAWRSELETLGGLREKTEEIRLREQRLRSYIKRGNRNDLDYVTLHLCTLINRMMERTSSSRRNVAIRLESIRQQLELLIDPDPSRQISDPLTILNNLQQAATQSLTSDRMTTPFELPSAELIRSDRQLMELFSDGFPRLAECRGDSPTYIYGPRGCGKSTVLRSLSINAVLDASDVSKSYSEIGFVGIYLSCSSELRSRFWLFRDDDFDNLATHIVRYFGLLLLEQLAKSLFKMQEFECQNSAGIVFGLTNDVAKRVCEIIRTKADLNGAADRYFSVSHFSQLAIQIRNERDRLWKIILNMEKPTSLPNSQMIFDICQDIEIVCPVFKEKKLAFLLDDYSNQRIPVKLQQILNKSITFSKQGIPLFKVSSEYLGLDLEGIQEGREVREVNVGREYVNLSGKNRWSFLNNLLEKRFASAGKEVELIDFLGLQKLGPATEMARAIKSAHDSNSRFYYHGIDTISDVCSGDFAMGIDLVRRIFEDSNTNWKDPAKRIADKSQHDTITAYGSREFQYIRYRWPEGPKKYELIERLCWLSKQCVLTKTTKKSGKDVPLVLNHFDISETVMRELEKRSEDLFLFLDEMIRKGVFFPLDDSSAREQKNATRRFMVRRILLAKYVLPLGRHTAIKIDHVERLKLLLSAPKDFVESELDRKGSSKGSTSTPLFDDADNSNN